MKILISALLGGCMLLSGVTLAMAQSDEGQSDPSDQPQAQQTRPLMQRGQQQGRRGGMRNNRQQRPNGQMHRMMPAAIATYITIDVDKNGELSKEEIEEATAALKKLDTDKDGKLTFEELMKAIPQDMRRPGPPQGGPDGAPGPRGGMRGQGRGQGPGPGPEQGPPPGPDQPAPDQPEEE